MSSRHLQHVTLYMLPIIKYVYLRLVCTYKHLSICLHMHNLQNELNKQGEIFAENVILKFHIYYEQ